MLSGGFFKQFRILLLLLLLAFVAGDAFFNKLRSRDWDAPLRLVVYPINGDDSDAVQLYIDQLSKDQFSDIEEYMRDEANHYKLPLDNPVTVALAPQINENPPPPPGAHGNVISTMWWSLKMRYWAVSRDNYQGPPGDIKMFVKYFELKPGVKLEHSLGLQKGLIGVVNGYGARRMEGKNNVVITHEFLHTLGATDKYDLSNGQPIYPNGYAKPGQSPLHPQDVAELMGGAIALSQSEWKMPNDLDETVIGPASALEINFVKEITE